MPDRFGKRCVLHAEENAILFSHGRATDCTIYVTREPCAACASRIIQVGITELVLPYSAEHSDDYELAFALLKEGDVMVRWS